jgi:hemolysin III
MIAGTITPICTMALNKSWGYYLVAAAWIIAIAGILYKVLAKDLDDDPDTDDSSMFVSTVLYVCMGLLALLDAQELFTVLPPSGSSWLIAGGAFYLFGTIFFIREDARNLNMSQPWHENMKKIFRVSSFDSQETYWDHEIFHICVVAGSACHWVVVQFYLIGIVH